MSEAIKEVVKQEATVISSRSSFSLRKPQSRKAHLPVVGGEGGLMPIEASSSPKKVADGWYWKGGPSEPPKASPSLGKKGG